MTVRLQVPGEKGCVDTTENEDRRQSYYERHNFGRWIRDKTISTHVRGQQAIDAHL
jgi:hypothetical protein